MEKLLATVIQLKASDLHISVGQPPVVRHQGRLKKLDLGGLILDNDDTTGLMKSISGMVGRSCGSVGNPSAALCAIASVPSASFGQRLGGGSTFFITQLRKCTRSALTVSVCATGFGASAPVP